MAKLSSPLNLKLLSRCQVRQAEAASVWRYVWIGNSSTEVLIRGVRSLGKPKLVTTARQTWVMHALGELRVARIGAIDRILWSAILGPGVHGLLEGAAGCR